MRPPISLVRIVERLRYSVEDASLLAGDDYWDGHSYERHGRNTWLYRMPRGAYFTVTRSQWKGEPFERLVPVDVDEALRLYQDRLTEHEVSYAAAFSGDDVDYA